MIDTHCHLTFAQLHDRLEAVLDAAGEAGVDRIITVGTTPADAERARRIAERHDGVYFTAGAHPHYAPDVSESDLPRLAELAAHERCAAFGEMGLDYHYDDPPPGVQRRLFAAQLEVVRYARSHKPIVIHNRKATDDVLAMIAGSGLDPRRFVFHCFTEPPDEARKVLDAGPMISFTGIVTYRNAPEVRASAALVPDDRIMIETDAPYLSPEPHRKVRPNEPRLLPATARRLADLRGADYQRFTARCDANAERFFNIGGT